MAAWTAVARKTRTHKKVETTQEIKERAVKHGQMSISDAADYIAVRFEEWIAKYGKRNSS